MQVIWQPKDNKETKEGMCCVSDAVAMLLFPITRLRALHGRQEKQKRARSWGRGTHTQQTQNPERSLRMCGGTVHANLRTNSNSGTQEQQ